MVRLQFNRRVDVASKMHTIVALELLKAFRANAVILGDFATGGVVEFEVFGERLLHGFAVGTRNEFVEVVSHRNGEESTLKTAPSVAWLAQGCVCYVRVCHRLHGGL